MALFLPYGPDKFFVMQRFKFVTKTSFFKVLFCDNMNLMGPFSVYTLILHPNAST